jgi:hypothetical protein
MTSGDRPDINMSGIRVAGVGGLGLVVVALVMATYYPEACWLLLMGTIGGVCLGVALVVYRRHRASTPSGDDPNVLFRAAPAEIRKGPAAERTPPDVETLVAAG